MFWTNGAAPLHKRIYFCDMSLLKLAGQILLIYLLYKLIVRVIIPLYRSARQMRRQFRQMQDTIHEQMQRSQHPQQQNAPRQQPSEPPVQKEGEYIDYEEVK